MKKQAVSVSRARINRRQHIVALVAMLGIIGPVALIAGCGGDKSTNPGGGNNSTPRFEAESFTDSTNTGGSAIVIVHCAAASGNYGVDGVDATGDWIRLPMTLSEGRTFSSSIRSAGVEGLVRTFAIWYRNGETVVAADTLTTPAGMGVT